MTQKSLTLCDSDSLTDLKLYQFGTDQFSSMEPDRPILSAHYTVHYITDGSGQIRIGNSTYSLKPGCAFVVFPNQIRQISPDTDAALTIQWIELEGNALPPELVRMQLSPNRPVLPFTDREQSVKTAAAFAQLMDNPSEHEAILLGLAWQILGAIIQEAAQIHPPRISNQRKYYVEQAMRLIQKSYMKDITVEDIAEHCQLNRSYLGKLFREETGRSTQEYLIDYRMEMACRYLRETTAPIGIIALSVGYQNQLHFSRAFRKAFGMSPRDWQKELRRRQFEESHEQ